MVDLAREVCVILARGFEHHLYYPLARLSNRTRDSYLRAIGELVRGEVDLAKRALPNQPP